jgi:hypothetical protein
MPILLMVVSSSWRSCILASTASDVALVFMKERNTNGGGELERSCWVYHWRERKARALGKLFVGA